MDLTQSQEDYLEAIYNEVLAKSSAKVTDISNILGVKKASVTGALNILVSKKLINYSPYSSITLTPKGEALAKEIFKKHNIITGFFVDILKMDKAEAVETACKMEHIVSPDLFERIINFSNFIKEYSNSSSDFQEKLRNLF